MNIYLFLDCFLILLSYISSIFCSTEKLFTFPPDLQTSRLSSTVFCSHTDRNVICKKKTNKTHKQKLKKSYIRWMYIGSKPKLVSATKQDLTKYKTTLQWVWHTVFTMYMCVFFCFRYYSPGYSEVLLERLEKFEPDTFKS